MMSNMEWVALIMASIQLVIQLLQLWVDWQKLQRDAAQKGGEGSRPADWQG